MHPPISEIVAAGFLRLIHEQTVILLKAITPAARANSRDAMDQRKDIPISSRERATTGFLAVKSVAPGCIALAWDARNGSAIGNEQMAIGKTRSGQLLIANC